VPDDLPKILFIDEHLMVINKPAGLGVLPDGYDRSLPHVRSLLEPDYGRLWIVHRLDKDTSGVLLLARMADSHRNLNTQFERGEVEKVYHALVVGEAAWETQIVDLPLRPNGDRHHRTIVDSARGKAALTEVRVLERYQGYTLLEAHPRTGRTHQIRAHLRAVGLPLVGDALYGGPTALYRSDLTDDLARAEDELPLIARAALHARMIGFLHPEGGEKIWIEAPYPGDFEVALEECRRHLTHG
jgi:tRNA pseudouridine32 synthase/23S rRNA pseudouridine746 synthase